MCGASDAGARGGHYYLADLVGLEVVNEQGEALGVVKRWLQRRAGRDGSRRREGTPAAVDASGGAKWICKRQIDVEWEADW